MNFDDTRLSLSLRGGGWGFPLATMNVAPWYFHRKREEKKEPKERSLAVLYPAYLLYL